MFLEFKVMPWKQITYISVEDAAMDRYNIIEKALLRHIFWYRLRRRLWKIFKTTIFVGFVGSITAVMIYLAF